MAASSSSRAPHASYIDSLPSYGTVGDYRRRESGPPRVARQRERREETWVVNNRVRKPMRPLAECGCPKKCLFEVISQEQAEEVRQEYQGLDRQVQRQALFGLIDAHSSRGGQRQVATYHIRHADVPRVQICQPAFCILFSLNRSSVVLPLLQASRTRHVSAPPYNFGSDAKKGRKSNLMAALEQQVISHINSFPREENHYGRASGGHREYLSSDLSVARMHQLYLERYEPEYAAWKLEAAEHERRGGAPPPPPPAGYEPRATEKKPNPKVRFKVLLSFYQDIFNTKFNLSFGKPINELCATCHAFDTRESSIETQISECFCLNDLGEAEDDFDSDNDCACSNCLDREQFKEDFQLVRRQREEHVRVATLAYDAMHHDQHLSENTYKTYCQGSASNFVESVFVDYEKNLHCPRLNVAQWFYARNYNIYNFGIFHSYVNRLDSLLFGEDVASQGQDATYSMLLRTLERSDPAANWLIVWSDSCSRQNKHYMAVHAMQSLVLRDKRSRIDLKFPVVGHSFLPCDRIFGLIEKQRQLKQNVYIPEQWRSIIERASNAVDSVTIVPTFIEDPTLFKRLAQWYDEVFSTTSCRTILGTRTKVTISTTAWINFGVGEEWCEDSQTFNLVPHKEEVWFKDTHDRKSPWIKCRWMPKVPGTEAPLYEDVQDGPSEKKELADEKIKSLLEMKVYVPEEYHHWYPAGTVEKRTRGRPQASSSTSSTSASTASSTQSSVQLGMTIAETTGEVPPRYSISPSGPVDQHVALEEAESVSDFEMLDQSGDISPTTSPPSTRSRAADFRLLEEQEQSNTGAGIRPRRRARLE